VVNDHVQNPNRNNSQKNLHTFGRAYYQLIIIIIIIIIIITAIIIIIVVIICGRFESKKAFVNDRKILRDPLPMEKKKMFEHIGFYTEMQSTLKKSVGTRYFNNR
jgi:flagellar basal body-associated protein FliL